MITNVWTPIVELGSGEKSFPFHDFRAVTVSPRLLCLSNVERSLRILHQNLGILHTSFPFLPFSLFFFKLSLSFYHINYQGFYCSEKKTIKSPYIPVLSKSVKGQRLVQCHNSGIEILWKPQPKIVFPSVIYSSCYHLSAPVNVISTVVTNPHHVSSMAPKMKNKK